MQKLSLLLFSLGLFSFACMKSKDSSDDSVSITKDQTLSKLIVSAGELSPAFDPFVTQYTLAGGETPVYKMNINAAPVNSKLQIYVNDVKLRSDFTTDTLTLAPGTNTFVIDLKDATGAKVNSYKLSVPRVQELTDHELSGIALSDSQIAPDFSQNVPNYTVTVSKDTSDLTVSPAANYPDLASFVINGETYAADIGSYDILVNPGNTTVTIEVKGQSGRTKTYTILVTRPSN